MRILLLGGTAEARELADTLAAVGIETLTSLAGRTEQARAADARVGGFGGVTGLAGYLTEHAPDAVVDATHPFAARISENAAHACRETGTPLLRLARPGWSGHRFAHTWTWVPGHRAAAEAAAGSGRVLLTVGRQPLPHYLALPDVVARVAEAPDFDLPAGWRLLATRGPFELADELALLRDARIEVLVSKDSGGAHTAAKLDAAAQQGVRVVMVSRPAAPAEVPEVGTVGAVLDWLRGPLGFAPPRLNPDQDPPPHR